MSAELLQEWLQWRQELGMLMDKHIPRCYYSKKAKFGYKQLHGFSDSSKVAYAAVVYLHLMDTTGCVQIPLVMAKAKVTPIKLLSVP